MKKSKKPKPKPHEKDIPEDDDEDEDTELVPDLIIAIGDLKICSRGRNMRSASTIVKELIGDKRVKEYLKDRSQIKFVTHLSNIPDYTP
jgi:hypothetical protein